MKKCFLIAAVVMSVAVIMTSCGGQSAKNQQVSLNQSAAAVMDVDSLLADAENLAGQSVEIEGVCTHICSHGARKIFLMGSDNTKTIRIEAGQNPPFDQKCVNSIVRVRGILVEDRIDEAYLQNWEAQLKAKSDEKHGSNEGGCSTEKNARGETGNSATERIAAFRKRIADREYKDGKAYLSFYHIDSQSYEIQQ